MNKLDEAVQRASRLSPLERQLRDALRMTLRQYVELAESGDCGYWATQEERHVIASNAALAAADETERQRGE